MPPLGFEISSTEEGGTRLISRIDQSFVQLTPSAHVKTYVTHTHTNTNYKSLHHGPQSHAPTAL